MTIFGGKEGGFVAYDEFAGVYTLLLTPFNEDLSIDYDAYEEYVAWQAAFRPQHLFAVCGSSEMTSLTREESDRLFGSVMEDYADIPSKKERMKRLRENPYFNALQIKYAYAVTCHKAQGGQWKNIFIDQGFVPEDGRDEEYYRWLYTALTRATERVYLVNWPE